MITRMREETAGAGGAPIAPEIETLIIMDREIDMVTPLLTQLTYEGLVDEYFKIVNSTHPLTHSLTHSPTHSLTHPLTHSLTHPPTHSPTHPRTVHSVR